MTFDLRQIMQDAWRICRDDRDYRERYDWTPGPSYGRRRTTTAEEKREVFARALRQAWQAAKQAKAYREAEAAKPLPPAADIRDRIVALENTERLGVAGIQKLSDMRRDLAEAERREAEKRELIASAEGRFCTVTFTKKDGSERVMRVQPAKLKHHVRGEAVSEAARKAVATRAARHPHLLPVWDAEKGAARSINLATVTRIAVNGAIHDYHTH